MNPDAREPFYEHIDAANVDLKGFSEDFYRTMTGGRLEPVLDTLRWLAHREQHLAGNHQPGHSAGERFARRDRADVPLDRRRAGAGRAAALLGVSSRLQAVGPRADAAGDAGRGLRHRPPLRPALRLHRQRQRPRSPEHLLPRLRPGGDRARRLSCWAAITFAKAAARTAARPIAGRFDDAAGRLGRPPHARPHRPDRCPAARPRRWRPRPRAARLLERGATAAGVPRGGPARGGRRASQPARPCRHPGRSGRHARLRQRSSA